MKILKSIVSLESLEARLRQAGISASIGGKSDGPFLFAKYNDRAIEASTNDGQWWLEAWDLSEDPDAPPVKDIVLHSEDEAFCKVIDWLRQQKP